MLDRGWWVTLRIWRTLAAKVSAEPGLDQGALLSTSSTHLTNTRWVPGTKVYGRALKEPIACWGQNLEQA